jgi:hypothetical protein
MRQFNAVGGIDKITFDKKFNLVFCRIYPSLKISDKDSISIRISVRLMPACGVSTIALMNEIANNVDGISSG